MNELGFGFSSGVKKGHLIYLVHRANAGSFRTTNVR